MLASQQVIEAVVARLVAASTGAGARVYSDRAWPVDTYPAIKVLHVNEDLQAPDEDVTFPATQLHQLQLDAVAYVQAPTGLDAALAAMALQVLQALQGTLAAATLQPLAGCTLQATGIRYQYQGDGEAATGLAIVRLAVEFHTASNDPETII
jgi:hypothetical protein